MSPIAHGGAGQCEEEAWYTGVKGRSGRSAREEEEERNAGKRGSGGARVLGKDQEMVVDRMGRWRADGRTSRGEGRCATRVWKIEGEATVEIQGSTTHFETVCHFSRGERREK